MGRLIAGLALAAFPTFVLASNPTPMFVMFIGLPALVMSIVIALFAHRKPKLGLGLSIVFLLAHIPTIIWASRVGYMDEAGGWLYASCGLGIYAFMVAFITF